MQPWLHGPPRSPGHSDELLPCRLDTNRALDRLNQPLQDSAWRCWKMSGVGGKSSLGTWQAMGVHRGSPTPQAWGPGAR